MLYTPQTEPSAKPPHLFWGQGLNSVAQASLELMTILTPQTPKYMMKSIRLVKG